MKHPVLKQLAAATIVTLTLTLYALPAYSIRPLRNVVSGTLTSMAGGQQLTVNGTVYTVKVTEATLRQLQQLQVGQKVDLVLSGPPGEAASQVVAIHVHSGS